MANGIEINLVGRFFDRKGGKREKEREREFGKRGGIRNEEGRKRPSSRVFTYVYMYV